MTTDYMNNTYVPLWEKELLNVTEATAFSGIGQNSIRALIEEHPELVFRVGTKHLIKRKSLQKFIRDNYSM